jgi:hypothetical protein
MRVPNACYALLEMRSLAVSVPFYRVDRRNCLQGVNARGAYSLTIGEG